MKEDKKQKGRRGNKHQVQISEGAKRFANITLKSFKKDGYFMNKKDAQKAYYELLVELLPDAVIFVVRYGHVRDEKVRETKAKIYEKLSDQKFIKKLTKEARRGNTGDLELLPILIKEKMIMIKRDTANAGETTEDLNALIELCKLVIAKKYKKLTKKGGVNPALAFDLLCIMPTKETLKISRGYRARKFYECLYEHAKHTAIPFDVVAKTIIGKDNYNIIIITALLARREQFTKLTDSQQKLYIDITTWCFSQLNEQSSKDISALLQAYINARARDDMAGKDAPRRYSLNTISESEYPKLNKVIQAESARSPEGAKYLG